MSTRQFLPRALRQCLTQARPQPQAQLKLQRDISTSTAKEAGFRQIRGANISQQLSQLGAGDNAPAPQLPNEVLRGILTESYQRKPTGGGFGKSAADALADLRAQSTTDQYVKMMPRAWEFGQVYAPRDLGVGGATRWSDNSQNKARKMDNISALGINPLDNYRNFSFISEYMTSYGRILGGNKTGLSPVNQRKMAKTIRRAVGLGIHPSVHFHPELLKIRYRGRGLPQVAPPRERKKAGTS